MKKVKITTEFIKLDQLLKLAGIADDGSSAKYMILNGKIKVNGEIELRRGKKIRPNDKIEIKDEIIIVES
ncbi:MAG: RNA-binding S4 domain-containing protein [Fusobacteriaceae bacterium]|nr:RNA-binding S4 domain-containing protein [Fusobacteriaceae bacterium]